MAKFYKKKSKHPYEKLNMGIIEQYSMIIKKSELEHWLKEGWVESPDFVDFLYEPEEGETVVLGKPKTIVEVGPESIVGNKIIKYSGCLGSYGMGGPGFFGLLLENSDGKREYIIYAVWASGEYILMDGRVIEAHADYNEQFHPWVSQWANEGVENWDDLSTAIEGAVIESVELLDNKFCIIIRKDNASYKMEFFRNDDRLPPNGSGESRKDAFDKGIIGDYIVFQIEGAVLHV